MWQYCKLKLIELRNTLASLPAYPEYGDIVGVFCVESAVTVKQRFVCLNAIAFTVLRYVAGCKILSHLSYGNRLCVRVEKMLSI